MEKKEVALHVAAEGPSIDYIMRWQLLKETTCGSCSVDQHFCFVLFINNSWLPFALFHQHLEGKVL